jgi:hypothetical protein
MVTPRRATAKSIRPAIETSLRGTLQLTVRKGMKLAWPRGETSTHFISMGTDVDLRIATRIAIQEMVDFLAATKKMDKHQAYQLTSLAGDVAITQLVDGTMGVHVKMPKSIFKSMSVQRFNGSSHGGSYVVRAVLAAAARSPRARQPASPRSHRTRSTPASRRHTAITRRITAAW